ncbi:MAG: uracil phosphoribosyltransferase [Acetobacteraceae bacterium]
MTSGIPGWGNVTVVDHPLVQHMLTTLRDHRTDSTTFRRVTRQMGLLLGYEITRTLPLSRTGIETPLQPMQAPTLAGDVCVVSILRAGNGLLEGMLDLFPRASAGHIGLARDEATLRAEEYYLKLPRNIGACETILVDPMLATGGSAAAAVERLQQAGARSVRFACMLAAPEGLRRLTAAHPDLPIVTAAIDDGLNDRGYICPGLGDAGDRFYGTT